MCPSKTTLVFLAKGELKGPEHRTTVLHLEVCARCADLYDREEEIVSPSPDVDAETMEAFLNEVAPVGALRRNPKQPCLGFSFSFLRHEDAALRGHKK
jgi:hypothetical protein